MKDLLRVMEEVSSGFNWDNYKNDDGSYYSVKEALFCKLEWVKDNLQEEELVWIIEDVQKIIEALPLIKYDKKEV